MSSRQTPDSFDFSKVQTAAQDDGQADSIWLDLGYPTGEDAAVLAGDAGNSAADAPDPLPVLMVIADQQDFYN